MKYRFKSAITRGGSIITPEKIIIDDDSVTWQKRNSYLIGFDSITIPRNKISSIEIEQGILGANIFVYDTGGKKIIGKNFTSSDAKTIKELLKKQEDGDSN